MKKEQKQRTLYTTPQLRERTVLHDNVICASQTGSSESFDEEFNEFNW